MNSRGGGSRELHETPLEPRQECHTEKTVRECHNQKKLSATVKQMIFPLKAVFTYVLKAQQLYARRKLMKTLSSLSFLTIKGCKERKYEKA